MNAWDRAQTNPDRMVHAECSGFFNGQRVQIVRYGRSGKWWAEDFDVKGNQVGRRAITITVAVDYALAYREAGGKIYLRRNGGRLFDARIKAKGYAGA